MRITGALVAGMFSGLLVGVMLVGPAWRLLTGEAAVPGCAPPMLAALGAAAGVLVERRTCDRAR